MMYIHNVVCLCGLVSQAAVYNLRQGQTEISVHIMHVKIQTDRCRGFTSVLPNLNLRHN